jgi:hypothetical protein
MHDLIFEKFGAQKPADLRRLRGRARASIWRSFDADLAGTRSRG